MNKLKSLQNLFALIFALILPFSATAATLGLDKVGPRLTSGVTSIDYLEFGLDGDLSAFGVLVEEASGASPSGLAEIGFGFGFLLDSPLSDATGGFDVFDDVGLFLAGDLIAVGFIENAIELHFGNIGGSGANIFGSSVLMVLEFADRLGSNPFNSFVDGDFYTGSISLFGVQNSASVPAPGTLSLTVLALFGFGCLQRMRCRKS